MDPETLAVPLCCATRRKRIAQKLVLPLDRLPAID